MFFIGHCLTVGQSQQGAGCRARVHFACECQGAVDVVDISTSCCSLHGKVDQCRLDASGLLAGSLVGEVGQAPVHHGLNVLLLLLGVQLLIGQAGDRCGLHGGFGANRVQILQLAKPARDFPAHDVHVAALLDLPFPVDGAIIAAQNVGQVVHCGLLGRSQGLAVDMLLQGIHQAIAAATKPLAGNLVVRVDQVVAVGIAGIDLVATAGAVDHVHQAVRIQRAAIRCGEAFLAQNLGHVVRGLALALTAHDRAAHALHLAHGLNIHFATQLVRVEPAQLGDRRQDVVTVRIDHVLALLGSLLLGLQALAQITVGSHFLLALLALGLGATVLLDDPLHGGLRLLLGLA